ncbi:hypothetical protein AXF42_Ash000363 [Apostasia shenzhenica]|uniref:Uncharacterized protein n=1 Tax=Apostasia shenzhenica TaxID=1088818 RepID=A0A2I0AG72_9ASPA|nr:hypothetical protein AXF42_Ash000363 [Apostasia shenzhenica]
MNAELHRSRAKLAEMEAAKSGDGIREQLWSEETREDEEILGSKIQKIAVEKKEYFLPSLATAIQLSEGDSDSIDGRRKTKMKKKKNKKKKKKPIVPLIGHLFSKKKNSIELGEDSLYTKPYYSVVI